MANTVTFEGNAASFISALSAHGNAVPIDSGEINNNSNPPSKGSTNGGSFVNCG
ncbi:hypothetical protein [Legionella oakridgensis]|uniref:hypothetical protein n=1 Tax=Legionella oakridgensis TaxID=29423 RepID=UPI0004B68F2C|nr:hypothetical protein [Legionella oakridgensis]